MALVISLVISAILAILFGIVILVWPRSLNYVVALWLILNGILQLIAYYN
jgi:uncharacterized membrane protein HdeD (DUF308 family)